MESFVDYLELPVYNWFTHYHFNEVLNSLATASFKLIMTREGEIETIKRETHHKFGRVVPDFEELLADLEDIVLN